LLPVDLMSLASHKTYGPKGIGALYVRRKPRVRIEAQMHGGGHERGMRSGTLPTHQCIGMGEAFRIAREEMGAENERIRMLQQRLLRGLVDIEQVFINGHTERRVPHNLNISFNFVEGESLLGLHLGQPGAELRAARAGPQRRARAFELAHDDRPIHDRRRDRLRGQHAEGPRCQTARTLAPVGDVQGWDRHQLDPMDRTLI
jgi:selenocysteine lyase/cysteine desulfurase